MADAPAALRVRLLGGRIENAPELRAMLGVPAADGDEALLEALLARGGPAGLASVRGGLAILAECAEQRRVLLARDALGLQPLHWTRHDGRVAAAVGAPPLLGPAAGPDAAAILEWLVYRQVLPPRTLFRHVAALPPGSAVELADGAIASSASLAPPERLLDAEQRGELAGLDERALVDRLERVLHEAVGTACAGRGEVGVMLSGGIDSTVIAALAREHTNVRALTMSVPDSLGEDEAVTARATAAALDIPLEIVPISTARYRMEIAGVAARVGRPGFHVRNAAFEVGFDAIMALAAAGGLDRALDGMSANLAVGSLGGRGAALRWLLPLARVIERLPLDGMLGRLLLHRAELPSAVPELASSLARGVRLVDGGARARIAADAFAAASGLVDPRERQLRATVLADLRVWLPRFLDRAAILGRHHGVSLASPFHDARVLALGLNLPERARQHGRGPDKPLLHALARRHMRQVQPHRPTRSWTAPLGRLTDPLAPLLLVPDGFVAEQLHLDAAALAAETAAARRVPGELGKLVQLEIWGRVCCRGENADALGERLAAAPPV